MAETGDLIKEFKEAKPPEKTVIILGAAAVVGIGLYLYIKNKSAAGAAPSSADPNNTTQTSGYPTANGVPVLPSGTNPLYDPNGNLVGYQNAPTGGGVAGPPGPPGPPGFFGGNPVHPGNWFTSLLGKVGYNATINKGGIDTNGQRFWIGTGKSARLFYAPPGSQINRGAAGRIWIQPPGANSGQLLTGPGMTKSKTTVAKTPAKKSA